MLTKGGLYLWRRKGTRRWERLPKPAPLPPSAMVTSMAVGDTSTFCLGVENIDKSTNMRRDEIVLYVAKPKLKVEWACRIPGGIVALACLGQKCAALVRDESGVVVWSKKIFFIFRLFSRQKFDFVRPFFLFFMT